MRRLLAPVAALALLGGWSAWPLPASGAVPRSQVAVRGQTVRLSDLFTGLQPGQDCDIGPAPAPAKRIIVPPAQLAAIASEFGVDWQAGSGYQAVTIERPARMVGRDEILPRLKAALLAGGAPADSEVSLAAFASPAVPLDATAPAEVQALEYDPRSGRFSASLSFAVAGGEPVTMRIVGRAEEQLSVLALAHALPVGAVLSPADLQTIRVRAGSLRGAPVGTAEEAVGLALRRPLGEGAPLLRDMLTRAMLVERGRPVILRLQADRLMLTAAGTALEAGAAGDRIHVVNSLSHAILVGRITDGADVRIDPGTAPMTQTTGMQNELPRLASSGGRGLNGLAQEARYP